MRQNPHVRICGGPGSATTLVYPTALRAPSVRADPAPCTRLDSTMPPTSFDIGFSLNPCPRKLGAPQSARDKALLSY